MRVLMVLAATAAVFSGGSTGEPRGLVEALTSVPDGGWTQVIEPRAFEHLGVVYFAFIDGDDGHVKAGSWDGTTTTLFTLGTAPEVDTHDAPVIFRRDSDSRLMVFWSGHGGPAMNLRISTNPLDVSAWGTTANLDAQLGGTGYTYPNVVQLLGEADDPIYLFYRDTQAGGQKLAYSTSTDGGTTWATQTTLCEQSGKTPYWVIGSDGDARIDIGVSSGHPINDTGTRNTYHLMRTGGTWKLSDGTALGSPPFTVTNLTLVATGPGWPHGVVSDGPTMAYTIDSGATTYYVATWDGSTWGTVTLEGAGALVGDATPMDAALIDADTVYATVKVGSRLELRRYKRAGAWASVPVTDGSSLDQIYPARIHDGTTRKVLWLRGTYTSYLDNSLRVMAGT